MEMFEKRSNQLVTSTWSTLFRWNGMNAQSKHLRFVQGQIYPFLPFVFFRFGDWIRRIVKKVFTKRKSGCTLCYSEVEWHTTVQIVTWLVMKKKIHKSYMERKEELFIHDRISSSSFVSFYFFRSHHTPRFNWNNSRLYDLRTGTLDIRDMKVKIRYINDHYRNREISSFRTFVKWKVLN